MFCKQYKLKDAAAVLSMHPNRLRDKIKAGEIKARKRGRNVIISEEELNRYTLSLPLVIPDAENVKAPTPRRPRRSSVVIPGNWV